MRPCPALVRSSSSPSTAASPSTVDVRPGLRRHGLVWAGVAGGTGAVMLFEHVAMLAGMLVVMLLRRDEYSGSAHAHPATA
jgi:hypothetical protein